jgi:hypothetical protein
MAADETDVLKALVDDALARGVHPDQQLTLTEWREANTTDEEKQAALTDEERAAREQQKADQAKETRQPSRTGGKT